MRCSVASSGSLGAWPGTRPPLPLLKPCPVVMAAALLLSWTCATALSLSPRLVSPSSGETSPWSFAQPAWSLELSKSPQCALLGAAPCGARGCNPFLGNAGVRRPCPLAIWPPSPSRHLPPRRKCGFSPLQAATTEGGEALLLREERYFATAPTAGGAATTAPSSKTDPEPPRRGCRKYLSSCSSNGTPPGPSCRLVACWRY